MSVLALYSFQVSFPQGSYFCDGPTFNVLFQGGLSVLASRLSLANLQVEGGPFRVGLSFYRCLEGGLLGFLGPLSYPYKGLRHVIYPRVPGTLPKGAILLIGGYSHLFSGNAGLFRNFVCSVRLRLHLEVKYVCRVGSVVHVFNFLRNALRNFRRVIKGLTSGTCNVHGGGLLSIVRYRGANDQVRYNGRLVLQGRQDTYRYVRGY